MRNIEITMDNAPIKQTRSFKDLGIYIDEHLSWEWHISYIAERVCSKIKTLNRLSSFLSSDKLLVSYKQTI